MSAAWLVLENHILYSMYATVGKPIINKIPRATNQAIIALKPNSNIDLEFLYYAVVFIEFNIYKYTSQITQSNLNARSIKNLPLQCPIELRNQKKIAEILSTIDTAIEKTEKLIKKYKQIKTGLIHDLFTSGVTLEGKLRPRREQAPELYKENPIGWIP
ncbi:MAG: restriction endonuclease subunit S [Melioribacteraceae bacterium]|nr:restriction endonuclease subunit S [Melioribacteraceae bacterium]